MARNFRKFNKRILSLLIEKAKGERSTREYAADCGVSYVQLHKLEMCLQENPPGKALLVKLAENAGGEVELEDFCFACGLDSEGNAEDVKKYTSQKSIDIQSKYNLLSQGQKKTVYDFIDYLLNYK